MRFDSPQQVIAESPRVGVNLPGIKVDRGEPGQHRAHPIEPARIEGRTGETPAVGGEVDSATAGRRQRAEGCVPARIARPCPVGRRAVHEARPFAGHGVFVATGQVEYPIRDPGEIRRSSQIAMISIDYDEGIVVRDGVDEFLWVERHGAGIKEYLTDEHEIPAEPTYALKKTRGKAGQWQARHAFNRDQAVLLQPGD